MGTNCPIKKMNDNLRQNYNQIPKKDLLKPEDSAERLEIILKNIDEAHIKENKTLETSLYKEAQDLFRAFTGEDIMEKAEAAAKKEVESEGSKMVAKKDFLSQEKLNKEIEAFKFKQQTFAVEKGWQLISEEERKQYLGDINNFISAIEKKIEELKKNGFDISKEIFYNMVANGYMFLDLKKSFFRGKMLIPVLLGTGAYKFKTMSIKEFENSAVMMQGLFDLIAKQAVEDRLNKELLYAKRRWQKRKMRNMREILNAATKTIKSEEIQEAEKMEIRKRLEEQIRTKIQKEVEAEERESLKKLSNIGEIEVLERLRDFEKLEKKTDKNIKKDVQKIEKSLEKDIRERTEEEKKIGGIMKKQIEKGKISKKRIAYLNKVTKEEEEKKEEKEEEVATPIEEAVTPAENINPPEEVATPAEEEKPIEDITQTENINSVEDTKTPSE